MQYKLRIELLSDLCPSSGEAYNSTIDTDIDYDVYGLPYISAKRLKGVLRESGELLCEWGKQIPIEKIFGTAGSQNGTIRIGNAELEQHDAYEAEIRLLKQSSDPDQQKLVHPQNILDLFSYSRKQTAMENGVAKEGSLRIIRVLKKGLCFVADVTIETAYQNDLQMICKVTHALGLNRTRGLGEVNIVLLPAEPVQLKPDGYETIQEKQLEKSTEYRLHYRLYLREPLILKSADRGQEKTQDYIEGNKILGILAQAFGNERYQELTKKDKIICSNLYITNSTERFTPVSAAICKIKDDTSGKYYNMATGFVVEEQTQKAGNVYTIVNGPDLSVLSVETQLRYHHSRAKDKSVGRALGDGQGEFYQLSSIVKGQMVAGFIQATGEQMQEILHNMADMRYLEIGYGRSAEYGKVELLLDRLQDCDDMHESCKDTIFVKLEAPLIMYNRAGMYTQEPERLAELIGQKLGKTVSVIPEIQYLKYTTIGGWQTMWKKPKPVFSALDKGTVIALKIEHGQGVLLPNHSVFIGERTMEGFGEITITDHPGDSILVKNEQPLRVEPKDMGQSNPLEIQLLQVKEEKMLTKAGRVAAQKLMKEKETAQYAATVNKLLLTLKEQKTEAQFRDVCDSIKTESKKRIAENILRQVDHLPHCLYIGRERAFRLYMKALLTEAKYLIRKREGELNHDKAE